MPNTCPACRYDLAGLPPDTSCPECGLEDAANALHRILLAIRKPSALAAISSFIVAILVYVSQPILAALIPTVSRIPVIIHALLTLPVMLFFIACWWRIFSRLRSNPTTIFKPSIFGRASLIFIVIAFIARAILHITMPLPRTTHRGLIHIQNVELIILFFEIVVFLAFLYTASMRIEALIRAAGAKYTTIIYALPVVPAIPLAFCLCAVQLAPPVILLSTTLLATIFYFQINAFLQPPASPTPPRPQRTPPPPDRTSQDPAHSPPA